MKKGLETAETVDFKETVSISGKDMPAIKGWKVGKEYQICFKGKMTSLSQDEYGDSGTRARFEIQKAQECDCDMTDKEESPEAKKAREISEKNKSKRRI